VSFELSIPEICSRCAFSMSAPEGTLKTLTSGVKYFIANHRVPTYVSICIKIDTSSEKCNIFHVSIIQTHKESYDYCCSLGMKLFEPSSIGEAEEIGKTVQRKMSIVWTI
jgi:hypothetical protein